MRCGVHGVLGLDFVVPWGRGVECGGFWRIWGNWGDEEMEKWGNDFWILGLNGGFLRRKEDVAFFWGSSLLLLLLCSSARAYLLRVTI